VIIVVNLPPEKDRRVIREAQALEAAGGRVTVIGPRSADQPAHLPGTRDARIRSFRQPFAGTGILSFVAEFGWAFVAVSARLLGVLVRTRVDGVQACNPPDVFWPVALVMRATRRPFVFDHHDLSPELYECKTDRPNPVALRVLRLFERLSWRCASAIVATNESYRQMALERGKVRPGKVTIVRNGPTLAEVGAAPPDPVPAPRRAEPGVVSRGFKLSQTVSGSMVALAHGTNDAQKTMGVITLTLITAGTLPAGSGPPFWVVVAAGLAIGLGTYVGGWRIIRTLGRRIIHLGPPEGFAAETVASSVLYYNALVLGAPISTTHTITSAIMGVGATKKVSAVRWGVAGNIVTAWILTFPGSALIASLMYFLVRPLFS